MPPSLAYHPLNPLSLGAPYPPSLKPLPCAMKGLVVLNFVPKLDPLGNQAEIQMVMTQMLTTQLHSVIYYTPSKAAEQISLAFSNL